MWVHTPRIESIFISFVSFSFNSHHVSIDIHHWAIPHCGQTQQFNIQHSKVNIALRASACKIIRSIRLIRVQNNLVFKPPVSAKPRTKIREIREIRVCIKYRVRSAWKDIRVIRIITSLRSVGLRRISCSKSRVPHVSAPPRTKIREIRMPIRIFVLSAIFVFKKYSVRSVCRFSTFWRV